MASALLANQNEAENWTKAQPPHPRGGGTKFMGKVPFSNPKISKKRQFLAVAPQPFLDVDESPSLMQPAVSDDSSSINRRPSGGDLSSVGYVTFNVVSYSKNDLIELKDRLVAELERIRRLKNRIGGSDFSIRSNSNLQNKKSIKKLAGNKRPFPSSNFVRENPQLMKNCSQILSKLMKNKHGYIFNSPVDVVTLQLHDYYDIIKHPMDLGTVKTRLGKNLYNSPQEFAADVRLTFYNAMKYNPKGHEVYVLAELLLSRFEDLFGPIKENLGDDQEQEEYIQEVQASSWDHSQSHRGVGRGEEMDRVRKDQESTSQVAAVSGSTQNQIQYPQKTPHLPVSTPSPMRAPPVKQLKLPKPKAKDPNKREMTLEEKHKLGVGLQTLPEEKMEQVVQIIRKRNGDLRQEDDEIELDIETLDTETLWELDRFVTNYKKMISKMKRQALIGVNCNDVASNIVAANDLSKDDATDNEVMEVATEPKKTTRKGEAGDEDVDIGDEMPTSSFPPLEIEKDNGHASTSSSSSSSSSDDSSSSSDSDSGSSSGSDSEDAHS